MGKEGFDKILAAFEDQKGLLIFSLFGYFYFIYWPIAGTPILPLLPPLQRWVFGILAAVVILTQILTWRMLRLFEKRNLKNPATWFLFLAEFGAFFFAVSFVAWPFYWLAESIAKP